MPGAQSLVTAILTDSWSQTRAALARLWARRRPDEHTSASSAAEVEAAGAELDLAREQALLVSGEGPEPERAGRMELFWIGYLAGQLAARPELADPMRALPTVLAAQEATSHTTVVTNKAISGTVHGDVVQADDVSGGIRFSR